MQVEKCNDNFMISTNLHWKLKGISNKLVTCIYLLHIPGVIFFKLSNIYPYGGHTVICHIYVTRLHLYFFCCSLDYITRLLIYRYSIASGGCLIHFCLCCLHRVIIHPETLVAEGGCHRIGKEKERYSNCIIYARK